MVMLRYLLDTNTVSDPTHPITDTLIARRLVEHAEEIATGAPVLHELLYGASRLPPSRKRLRVEQFIASAVRARIPILPYDETAANWHAVERARLTAVGRTPSFVDSQIAAIAAVNQLTLVTRNTRDFQHFRGLQVVDWSV